ncbi:MAG: polysaccharide deacetylase family protein [bacterium]|nr:polysaccharide deacetylase family protein [bacterium]MDZ4285456.1 polysaccharide deacetylase family protein [Candidatus Sungbacteria bacterium]
MKRYGAIIILILAALGVYYAWSKKDENVIRVPILAYHNIRPDDKKMPAEVFMTPEEFEHELRYLKENGFQSIAFDDLTRAIQFGAKIPEKSIILTFDDSWGGQYVYALPLLQKYAFKGAFFIWTDMLDKRGYLSSQQLRELASSGMEIGGHGKSHFDLTKVADAVILRTEVNEDKKALEEKAGTKINNFAYPFGTFNTTVTDAVIAAGYRSARATTKGAYHDSDTLFALHANVMSRDFNLFLAAVNFVDYKQERSRIKKKISRFDGGTAYEWFKSAYGFFGQQHLLGHIFGEELYNKYGISGLSTCDSEFIFACYHGFLGKALSAEGLGAVEKLGKECDQKKQDRLGCDHGVGHGIVAYLGDKKLTEALESCARLSWKGLVGGCSGGVFMEYNFKNSHIPENGDISIRTLDDKNPFAPCDSLPERFQYACYYEQPDWWSHVYREDFIKVAKLCDSLKNKEYKDFCFIGTGRIIAQAKKYEVKDTIELCRDMPGTRAEVLCRSGGFLSIIDYTHDRDHSLSMCEGLDVVQKSLCMSNANLFGIVF